MFQKQAIATFTFLVILDTYLLVSKALSIIIVVSLNLSKLECKTKPRNYDDMHNQDLPSSYNAYNLEAFEIYDKYSQQILHKYQSQISSHLRVSTSDRRLICMINIQAKH